MLATVLLLLVLGGVSFSAPKQLPQSIAHDQIVAAIVSQVSTQTLEYELAGLTGERPVNVAGSFYTITTRNSRYTKQISMATRYAYERFASLGLSVTYHYYGYEGHQWRNVVAEKPGVVDADEIYLITAHVDDMPEQDLAPGADDNGSGSVAVLLAARLLAPHRFIHTLRFVLFTGEEQGLYGSSAYAADCQARGENIAGVVNVDMISYNSDAQPIIDLHAHTSVPASLELTRLFSEVIGSYDVELVPHRFVDEWTVHLSDQWSFLTRGYPAFLAIEDWDDHTPQYHEPGDRVSTLDLVYYADFARAAIATFAHLGRLLPGGYISGVVYAADTGLPLSATVAARGNTYNYTFTVPTNASGVYALPLAVGGYTLTVLPANPGYYPATLHEVLVVTDTTGVEDAALKPWPRSYLPWVIREP